MEEEPIKKKVITRKSRKNTAPVSNLIEELTLTEENVKLLEVEKNKVSETFEKTDFIGPGLRVEPDKILNQDPKTNFQKNTDLKDDISITNQTNDETSSIFTVSKINLKPYQKEGRIEVGLDEAGRGCFLGRVYAAGVILPNNILEIMEKNKIKIRDSKKLSKKNRIKAREFIEKNALAYAVAYRENTDIDKKNILRATMEAMHECVSKLSITPEKILVDGTYFPVYRDASGEFIEDECVTKGDDTYLCIAAASILAKTYKDEYIENLVKENPELEIYDLLNNSGYGTAKHIEAIKNYGLSDFHRKTFGICKDFVNEPVNESVNQSDYEILNQL